MKVKQLVLNMLIAIGILGFILGVSILDRLSEDNFGAFVIIGAILALMLWVVYIVLVLRDNAREKRALNNAALWMNLGDGQYTAMDGSGRTRPLNDRPRNAVIYDQEEDKA